MNKCIVNGKPYTVLQWIPVSKVVGVGGMFNLLMGLYVIPMG